MLPVYPVSTFGSPLDDKELWRCANLLCQQHPVGNEALIHANERMLDLAEADDKEGAQTWAAIALRIMHLKGGKLPGAPN